MRLLVAAFFLAAFLDALTTYVAVSSGVGVEANPALADLVNNNPAAVFLLALISAAVPSAALYVATELSRMLPAHLRAAALRLLTSVSLAAVVLRAAVVVNNLALIST
jgi:hypothetical protein